MSLLLNQLYSSLETHLQYLEDLNKSLLLEESVLLKFVSSNECFFGQWYNNELLMNSGFTKTDLFLELGLVHEGFHKSVDNILYLVERKETISKKEYNNLLNESRKLRMLMFNLFQYVIQEKEKEVPFAPVDKVLTKGEYHWCSCGRSKQRPFCDGSHGSSVNANDKPFVFYIRDLTEVKLCGCGKTNTPPYCDGSHLKK
mgnify:CR=1 FL=1